MGKKDTVILDQMDWLRRLTLRTVKSVTENEANIIPEGFRNNILWNLGHVYFDQYLWLQYLTGEIMPYHEDYVKLFKNGTNPSQWEYDPPSKEILLQQLEEQTKYIREVFQDRLDDPFPKKSGMKTVRHVLVRTLMHESMHLNTIKSYKKLIK